MSDKVAVVMGGTSTEREVSLKSGRYVLKGLLDSGINAVSVDPKCYPLTQLKEDGFTKVFNILHGRGGEDGVLQGLLEFLHLPYTGSGVLASALTMDKLKSKLLFKALDLPVTDYVVLHKWTPINLDEVIDAVGLPLIVKPTHEGSSIGMSKVTSKRKLHDAVQMGFQYDDTLLVETCLTGPEFTVGIVGEEILPSIRIETDTEFYDYEAKYQSCETRFYCPGTDSECLESQLKALALGAYHGTGCRGWGRVDIMLDDKNNPYVLEVNTTPGMTDHSLVPAAAKAYGWTFSELVCRILALAETEH